MSPGTRSRIVRLLLAAAIVVVVRELSIRRHEPDLTDWPRTSEPSRNGA